MSQKRIWSYALPTSLLLICLFQNCSGGSFDVINPTLSSNFGSSYPGAGSGDTTDPNSPSPTPTPASTPITDPLPPPTPTPSTGNLPPDPNDTGRRILKVCPSGCSYALPSAAVAASLDNDIIEVAGGNYDDCFTVTKNNIKLRGVNGRAHLTGRTCSGKGEINIGSTATGTVIESFEFSGMTNSSGNGSGIRSQGIALTVRNCYFHDGEEGILSNPVSGAPADLDSILVENSKFERLGKSGQAHAVYFGAHVQIFIRNSQFLSSKDEGHEFKSRAKNTSIGCSIFASLDGVDSYSLNFPDAGNVEVKNSFVEQGAASANSAIIDYGSEHTAIWPSNLFNLSNITVVNDRSGGAIFQVKGTTQFTVSDSVVAGPGNMFNFQSATFTNVKTYPDRSSASIAPYPAMPTPTGCTNIGLSY